ncbi:MAG: sugar transferase [bacterium]
MKRIIDLIVTFLALILMAPFLGFIAVLVRINLGAPILFRQIRPGLSEQPFTLYKFRTMTDARDVQGNLLSDTERLTIFGRFLRNTSLDELPELFNVFKGDMSLVGPRPLLMEYLEHYNAAQKCRHDVKPGITGWAQVNGRNAITWEEKFKLDIWYVNHYSVWLDFKIIGLTIWKVLKCEGISQPGHATMEAFKGRNA